MNGAPKPPAIIDGFDPPEPADEAERDEPSPPLDIAVDEGRAEYVCSYL